MSLNSTIELAQKHIEALSRPDQVRVEVGVKNVCGFTVPSCDEDDFKVVAYFKKYTVGDHFAMESACSYEVDMGGRSPKHRAVDFSEMRRLWVRHSLLDWNLDIPIEREGGWMTEDSYQRVSSVSAPVLDELLSQFEDSFAVSEDEESIIDRQSIILFSPNGGGVSNACEAISKFCNWGTFWEKFGINEESLPSLSYKEFQEMRMLLSNESQAHKRNAQSSSSGGGNGGTRIAGPGGKIRASRGKSISM